MRLNQNKEFELLPTTRGRQEEAKKTTRVHWPPGLFLSFLRSRMCVHMYYAPSISHCFSCGFSNPGLGSSLRCTTPALWNQIAGAEKNCPSIFAFPPLPPVVQLENLSCSQVLLVSQVSASPIRGLLQVEYPYVVAAHLGAKVRGGRILSNQRAPL